MYRINKAIWVTMVIFIGIGCSISDRSAAEFWGSSNSLNEALHTEFKGTNQMAILQGFLNPKDESILDIVDEDKLYIAIEGKRDGNNWIIQKVRSSDPNSEVSYKTIYTKTSSGSDELYEIHRRQYARIGNARPSVTWSGIDSLITKGGSDTHTQDFLCRTMECSELTSDTGRTLIYELNDKTKKSYPAFYKKFSKLLSMVELECKGVPDSIDQSAIQFTIQNTRLKLQLPPEIQGRTWKNPKTVQLNLNLTVRNYGITLNINNIKYILTFNKSGKSEILTGRFNGLPESSVEGRFFYIIPQGLVNLFIPSDIESYLKKGIQLMTVGSDGKKGNRFTTQYGGDGSHSFYEFKSYAEVYRKKFSLIGDSKPEEDEGVGNQRVFFRDLYDSIRQDLAQ